METNYTIFDINENGLQFFYRENVRMVQAMDSELIDCIDLYGLLHPKTIKASQKLDKKIVSMQKQLNRIKEKGLLDKTLAFYKELNIKNIKVGANRG